MFCRRVSCRFVNWFSDTNHPLRKEHTNLSVSAAYFRKNTIPFLVIILMFFPCFEFKGKNKYKIKKKLKKFGRLSMTFRNITKDIPPEFKYHCT